MDRAALNRGNLNGSLINLRAIGFGILSILVLTLAIALVLAAIVFATSLNEPQVMSVLYYVGLVTLAVGGAIGARLARSAGWLHGGLTGFGYVAIAALLTMLVFPGQFGFRVAAIRLAAGFLAGAVGGIAGVNL